jgi:2,3-diketo-5-methylthio-1-phosphopentane phosphatase
VCAAKAKYVQQSSAIALFGCNTGHTVIAATYPATFQPDIDRIAAMSHPDSSGNSSSSASNATTAPAPGRGDARLPAMRTRPQYVFFTDFDGTITQQDSNDFLTDTLGFGPALRRAGNADVLHGRRHFRDAFREMMDSIHVPFGACVDALLGNIALDPYFKEFYAWANEQGIPVVVLSGGMRPVIVALLRHLLGEGREGVDGLQIVSNDVEVRPGKAGINEKDGWRIVFHDER